MSEPSRRAKRIAPVIRDHIAAYLVSQVGDKRLAHLVVTEVRVSDDLSMAWVSVRLLLGRGSDLERSQCIKQLQLLAGKLRRSMAPALALRRIPELRFAFDEGYDAQLRVEEILKEIKAGPAADKS
jgi:ribosome-binding factor A